MRHFIIVVFLILPLHLFAESIKPTQTQQIFIHDFLPSIIKADQAILAARNKLKDLYLEAYFKYPLSAEDVVWLEAIAHDYDVNDFDIAVIPSWDKLLMRVDIIPPSMALAQAITESAWGTSRFAETGNNFYGLHCYAKGCGILPLERSEHSTMEVRRYRSKEASIADYIHNINISDAYFSLRQERALIRGDGESVLKGRELVDGLAHYSVLGQDYVVILDRVISQYQLGQYDYL